MDKKKKVMGVLIALTIIFTVVGSTFAYLSWSSSEEQKTNVTFTKEAGYSCSANGGGNITESDVILMPTIVNDSTTAYYIKRTVTVNPSITDSILPVYMDLWLDINTLGEGLSNSDNFMYAFTTSSTSPTTGVVSSGNFKGLITGNKVYLLLGKKYTKTTTETYYLWIWLDSSETSSDTMNQSFSLTLNGSCSNRLLVTANTLISKANPSTLLYSDATDIQKAEMWAFSHDATIQKEATTDYRYIGNRYCSYESDKYRYFVNKNGTCPKKYNYIRTRVSDGSTSSYILQSSCPTNSSSYTYECTELTIDGINGVEPNNYITYNNEVWRIIGVFDERIKIIKDDSLGNMYWDYKNSGVGSSTSNYGSNDWSDSQLMYMLNPTSYKLKDGYSSDGTYIYDGSGNIIYQLGCQPASIASGATSYSCTTNTWSLNSTALSQISETTYYLGGTVYNSTSYYGTTEEIYTWERGTKVYNGRPTNWTGLVGLMYPSDYAYTFANGIDDICYTNIRNCTNNNGANPPSSWLYKSIHQWSVSAYSGYKDYVHYVNSAGVGNVFQGSNFGVRPVVYLKSTIKLDGTGTSSDPYEIVE